MPHSWVNLCLVKGVSCIIRRKFPPQLTDMIEIKTIFIQMYINSNLAYKIVACFFSRTVHLEVLRFLTTSLQGQDSDNKPYLCASPNLYIKQMYCQHYHELQFPQPIREGNVLSLSVCCLCVCLLATWRKKHMNVFLYQISAWIGHGTSRNPEKNECSGSSPGHRLFSLFLRWVKAWIRSWPVSNHRETCERILMNNSE